MHARRSLPLLLALVALTVPSRSRATVVDAADAIRWAGSTVTVEGDVAAARSEPMGLVLELAPLGEKSFRAVLVTALISSLPRSPERIYAGKRVRVTGIVQRFQGRPEMVLESAGQIEIVDVAGAPAATVATSPPATTTTRPAAAAPPPAVAAPVAPAPSGGPAPVAPTQSAAPPATAQGPAPAAPAATPPPPVVTAPAPAAEAESNGSDAKPLLSERLAQVACDRARARWREVAERAREASAALTRCLDTGHFDCHQTAAALAPVLGDLEWAEQRVADRCE